MWLRTLVVACCLLALAGDAQIADSQIGIGAKRQPPKAEAQAEKSTKAEPKTPGAADEKRPSAPLAAKTFDPGKPSYLEIARDRESAILEKLKQPVSIDRQDIPLKEMLEIFEKALGVQIVFDKVAMRDAAIDEDKDVSLKVYDIAGRSALEILLQPYILDWYIENEVVWITTRDKFNTLMTVRVHPVGDLVYSTREGEDFDPLLELITSSIEPQTWAEVGGPGSIAGFGSRENSVLVLEQTWRVHEKTAQLLADLRAAGVRAGSSINSRIPKASRPDAPRDSSTPDDKESEEQPNAARGNNALACDLFARLSSKNKNFVFSPLAVTTGMGMAYAGANGATADQLSKALHFGAPQTELHADLSRLERLLTSQGGGKTKIAIANRLWRQQGHPFLESYINLCQKYYGATPAEIDFTKTDDARKEINAWVAEQTGGQIRELVSNDLLNDKLRLALVSAVSFRGIWTTSFSPSDTTEENFYGLSGRKKMPLMMSAFDKCRYAAVDNVQILERPYRYSSLVMTVILPKSTPEAFTALQGILTADQIDNWVAALRNQEVELHLPKFQMTSNLPLVETLTAMGAEDAFTPAADFSGIDGTRDLFLTTVLQQASIEVDEVGTKAAAATFGGGGFGGPPPVVNRQVFRADHSFVFLIRDKETGCILFMGQFVDAS